MISNACPFCVTVKASVKVIYCNQWIHKKFNNLNDLDSEDLKIIDES